jgi:Fe2+ or Zn2+ uptake regulation protein
VTSTAPEEQLRAASLRVTRPRVAVLAAVGAHPHADTETVIAAVRRAVGETPCLTAADDHGFSLEEAEVIYWGMCPDCSRAAQA